MVSSQLRRRGIRDERVLEAMARVPRHHFVPEYLWSAAYEDRPLPIGCDQTISQPYMVGRMLEALELRGDERVLDVGTGSGYQAALLGELAREVWSVEIIVALAESARTRIAELGESNVHVLATDGSVGLAAHAPYDGIVVAAGAPAVPEGLVAQLVLGGRLVIPVGDLGGQTLLRVRRTEDGAGPGYGHTTEALLDCAFVPLVGEQGWRVERADSR